MVARAHYRGFTAGVRVKKDDWGDMTAPQIYYDVPFPAPEDLLRPL